MVLYIVVGYRQYGCKTLLELNTVRFIIHYTVIVEGYCIMYGFLLYFIRMVIGMSKKDMNIVLQTNGIVINNTVHSLHRFARSEYRKDIVDSARAIIRNLDNYPDVVEDVDFFIKSYVVYGTRIDRAVDDLLEHLTDDVENINITDTVKDHSSPYNHVWWTLIRRILSPHKDKYKVSYGEDTGEYIDSIGEGDIDMSRAGGTITVSDSGGVTKYKVRKELVPGNRDLLVNVDKIFGELSEDNVDESRSKYKYLVGKINNDRNNIIADIVSNIVGSNNILTVINPHNLNDRTLVDIGWYNLLARLGLNRTMLINFI